MQSLGLLSASLAPAGYLAAFRPRAFQIAPGSSIRSSSCTAATWARSALPAAAGGRVLPDRRLGAARYHSASLNGRSFGPAVDMPSSASGELVHWAVDEPGSMRRRPCGAWSSRCRRHDGCRWTAGAARRAGRGPHAPQGRRVPSGPAPRSWLIQCAYDLHTRDGVLADFADQRDRELDELKAGHAGFPGPACAAGCCWLGTVTFAAAVLGCCLAGALGPAPLAAAVGGCQPGVAARLPPAPGRARDCPANCGPSPSAWRRRWSSSSGPLPARSRRRPTSRTSCARRWPPLLATTELALRKPRDRRGLPRVAAGVPARRPANERDRQRLLTLARLDAGVDQLRASRWTWASWPSSAPRWSGPWPRPAGLHLETHRRPTPPGSASPPTPTSCGRC